MSIWNVSRCVSLVDFCFITIFYDPPTHTSLPPTLNGHPSFWPLEMKWATLTGIIPSEKNTKRCTKPTWHSIWLCQRWPFSPPDIIPKLCISSREVRINYPQCYQCHYLWNLSGSITTVDGRTAVLTDGDEVTCTDATFIQNHDGFYSNEVTVKHASRIWYPDGRVTLIVHFNTTVTCSNRTVRKSIIRIYYTFVNVFGRHVHIFYFGPTGTPILDFWCRFLWVSKPE